MYKILIKNAYLIDVINKQNSRLTDILIIDNLISKIEKNIKEETDKTIDANSNFVMPGLINTHNHSAMNILRGYADDLELMDWLNNKIWPIEDKLTTEDVYYGSLLACIEMIKSGTTMFNDMYFETESTIKAVQKTGIRAMLGRCIMGVENDEDSRVKEAVYLIEKYKNLDEKITFNIAPHAPYTCNIKSLEICVKLAKKYNLPIHIHLAETKDEVKIIKEKYNKTPTEFLKQVGILDLPVILAHGVWVNDKDIEILKNIKGGIAHNPISNCKLASGIAPIEKYLKSNINVSLGTDGAASTNTLDMFEEMKVCNYLQKVNTLKSSIINAYTALQMATINGAKVLGLEKEIGSIEVGKKADLIILNSKPAKVNPINDIYSNIVYASNGNDVLTTIINGKIVMENRKINFIDENEVVQKCNEKIKKII
jgi:5-methylthioadenosine/S-adenosylhomocysteine deaminase